VRYVIVQIRPILIALRRHRLATLLIAVEIALACAVLCNACFLIANRLAFVQIDSGVDGASLATIQLTGYDVSKADDLNARVLTALHGIAGVKSVSVINSIPFGMRRGTAGIFTDAAAQHFGGVVDFYVGGPGSFKALGLQMASGRAPQSEDYQQPVVNFVPASAPVQITRALAEHLWPGTNPIGKQFWMGTSQFRVVGVLNALVRPDPSGPADQREWSVFVPAQPGPYLAGSYLLRAEPGDLPHVMRDALATIAKTIPDVVIDRADSHTLDTLRRSYFEKDRTMMGMLAGVIIALLLVTALGIVGLTSFWVTQRRKQIGIRRALGATRGDILRYFQTENFLIVTFGIVLGMTLAYGINLFLMTRYELPHLPWLYLPVGAIVLLLLGQLAVLGPALRAAQVPPVVATRSV
jgi:putative ABC transport system permease protein